MDAQSKTGPARGLERGLLLALVVLAADQLVKWMVLYPLDLEARQSIRLLPIFNLTWVENNGVSLNYLRADTHAMRWLLVAFTGCIAVAVLVWMRRERNRTDLVALAFVLGGALGNIADRVRLGFVVDFLDLHFGAWRPFLVFNVADAAITIGVLMLLGRALLGRFNGRSGT